MADEFLMNVLVDENSNTFEIEMEIIKVRGLMSSCTGEIPVHLEKEHEYLLNLLSKK